ncbi:TonB-dependent receptor [Filimonas zeae]|uniref:TonB-dependent receptor n=1 Tax=Filimonas zeae TaxID=1737353 RepID=A0A917J037_9BACT|nr:TonB-dependent receptor [Filimonas zeae]
MTTTSKHITVRKFTPIFLLLLVLSARQVLQAQVPAGSLSGRVLGKQHPLEAATVQLLKAKDSSLIKTAVSDKAGVYTIAGVVPGSYLVAVEAVGYEKRYSPLITVTKATQQLQVADIQPELAKAALEGVTVTAKKQLIEQKLDKTIVNVDASPTNAGLSALDVLEKSPGITVDKDGNISLKGKAGVLVLVDGKPTYLSGTDLVNILKNMPSSNLDQVEIMTNPPARYDAAGNSGVINLRTKKTKITGFNGSVTLGAGMGLRPKSNNSINLNYRTGKVNLFGNYSHYWNKNQQDTRITRNFRNQSTEEIMSVFTQRTVMKRNNQSHNFKAGVDYYLTSKTTIGGVVTGFFNPRVSDNDNVTQITKPGAVQVDSITVADYNDKGHFNNLGANVNLRHQFDSTGREFTADVDYLQYKGENNQYFRNIFYNGGWSKTRADEYMNGALPSDIRIYSAKADYTHPMKDKSKLEAGVKTSVVKTDNDARYTVQNLATGNWDTDKGRSNHFVYRENINAAYANYSRPLSKKWSAQLGVRVENTNARGEQLTTGEVFNRNYTQLFPTAYIGYTANGKNQFALSYGRRIQRPDYEDMNPFYYFLDKYTFEKGNPSLRPQFSHNIELNHTWNSFLTSGIGYSQTNDIIMDVLEQVDSITTTYQTKSNIAKTKVYTASISANMPVTKWWKANIYAQANHSRFSGVVNNGYLEVNGNAFMTNISNQFQIGKTWNLELSGFFRSSAVEGVIVSKPMGALNFAVSKQIMNKKGSLRLNIRDFLNVQAFRGYSRYQNVDINIYNQWDNRVVNVSFTYRFSKGQAAQQRKRGGAGDEQNRVKGDN